MRFIRDWLRGWGRGWLAGGLLVLVTTGSVAAQSGSFSYGKNRPTARHEVFLREYNWEELKGKHFLVYYQDSSYEANAKKILRRAEDDYRSIGDRIGFTRYGRFWTWDDRVRIFLFPDKDAFLEAGQQPEWSTGFVDRDPEGLEARMIVTYPQEEGFFDGLLPHEISHLILHDFIRDRPVPVWFDEGVAQLEEAYKSPQAATICRRLVREGKTLPVEHLVRLDIRKQTDEGLVSVFYAQSLSMVEFLIKKYGSSAFQHLCRNLRDNKPFEEALTNAYSSRIESLRDFEQQWMESIR